MVLPQEGPVMRPRTTGVTPSTLAPSDPSSRAILRASHVTRGASISHAQRLGGRALDQVHEYDEGTVAVLADVEGNEFCLVWRKNGSSA